MIKAYASYFVSYMMANFKEFDSILRIILFGSVAKSEAGKQSDIDIFIEVKKNKIFEKEVHKIVENFYKSREALLFKTKGIENKINIIIRRLDDWKELGKSVESTGIILYGKFSGVVGEKGKKYSLFYWDNIKKNRGAFLNKVYGFTTSGKTYKGILEQFGCLRRSNV